VVYCYIVSLQTTLISSPASNTPTKALEGGGGVGAFSAAAVCNLGERIQDGYGKPHQNNSWCNSNKAMQHLVSLLALLCSHHVLEQWWLQHEEITTAAALAVAHHQQHQPGMLAIQPKTAGLQAAVPGSQNSKGTSTATLLWQATLTRHPSPALCNQPS
jgi:hypothetical protein